MESNCFLHFHFYQFLFLYLYNTCTNTRIQKSKSTILAGIHLSPALTSATTAGVLHRQHTPARPQEKRRIRGLIARSSLMGQTASRQCALHRPISQARMRARSWAPQGPGLHGGLGLQAQPGTSCIRPHRPQKGGTTGTGIGPHHIPPPAEPRTHAWRPARWWLFLQNPDHHSVTGGQVPLGALWGLMIPVAPGYLKGLARDKIGLITGDELIRLWEILASFPFANKWGPTQEHHTTDNKWVTGK